MTRRRIGLWLIGLAVAVLLGALAAKNVSDNPPPISTAEAVRILEGGEPEPASPVPLVLAVAGGLLLIGGVATVISSSPATSADGSAP